MSVFHNNALIGAGGGAAAAAAAHQIDRSLRFSSDDSSYLNRTPSSAGNQKTFTFSCWVKISKLDAEKNIFVGSSNWFRFESSNEIYYWHSGSTNVHTDAKFRDPAGWQHLVLSVDTTQSTASDRVKIYVNGVQQALSGTQPSQNATLGFNGTYAHYLGSQGTSGSNAFNGCIAEIHNVDGSQLAASDFGQYDDNNVWQPRQYNGTYGTNGFRLDFSDNSSAAALGTDSSGNSNTFTVNNLTATARNYTSEGSTSGSFYDSAGGAASKMFDGDASTGAFSQSGTATFTFGGSTITASTSLQVRAFKGDASGANVLVNGTDISSLLNAQSSGGYSTVDVTSTLGGAPINLSNVSVVNASGGSGNIAQIFVDGTELIDANPRDIDSLLDSPTNYDDGTNIGGNYCTMNPLLHVRVATLSNGNLDVTGGSYTDNGYGTIAVPSGKWYAEATVTGGGGASNIMLGVKDVDQTGSTDFGAVSRGYGYRNDAKRINSDVVTASYGATYTDGDVIGIALDLDAGTIAFYKNGSSQGTAYSGISSSYSYHFCSFTRTTSDKVSWNFGQRPFKYTNAGTDRPASTFLSVCTTNLPDPAVSDGSTAFDAKLWTGDGSSSRAITGYNHSPDFVWIKIRNDAYGHAVFDAVRGPNIRLDTVGTNPDQTVTDGLHSFDSNGFTIGNRNTVGETNGTYVGWAWDAGANSSKTFTVKVVSDSGNKYRFDDFGTSAVTLDLEEGSTYVFDQSDSSNSGHPLRFSTTSDGTHNSGSEYTTGVTTTGTPGSAGAKTTIVVAASAPTLYYYCSAHSGMGGQANTNSTAGASNFDGSIQSTVRANASAGISVLRFTGDGSGNDTIGHGLLSTPEFYILKDRDSNTDWLTYTTVIDGTLDYMYLNTTGGKSNSSYTAPTSSVFTYGTDSADYVCYLFHSVEGFSKFGTYVGNNSTNGTFVPLSFRPAWVMVKSIASAAYFSWVIVDSTRSTYNPTEHGLFPNSSENENDLPGYGARDFYIDLLSNGFKLRIDPQSINTSGQTYFYAAFAEHPQKFSRAR